MTALPAGIRRLTFPLPLGIGHVHCYLLPGSDGWTLVDTGLGLPDAETRWGPVLEELDAPVARIVVTHFHPDHAGGGEDAQALTGARVFQGARDYEQCEEVWGTADWSERLADSCWRTAFRRRKRRSCDTSRGSSGPSSASPGAPSCVAEGDEVDGWTVLELPGHADGHICLLRDGILVAGDHLLAKITPTVGLYPRLRPDPLGDYLASLERTIELAPTVALAGHNDTVSDPVSRARELIEHHRQRLDEAVTALGSEPRSAFEVSLSLFGESLDASNRRFALAETLAHLERLVHEGRVARTGDDSAVSYTAA